MRPALSLRHLTLPAVMAGFVAVTVGYTSSAAIIFQPPPPRAPRRHRSAAG